jgi:methylmalonyl-CoA mutase cobalamin-binding subunit
VSEDRTGRGDSIDLSARARAYELLRAALSDLARERGESAARSAAGAVLAEDGIEGLAEVAVDLALRLASALERIATDQGLTAVDLAEVWFAD